MVQYSETFVVQVKSFSHVWLFVTAWTIACQAPLSTEFSRQGYWSGLPFPFPGDLPDPGIEPRSSTLQADSLPYEPPGKIHLWINLGSNPVFATYQLCDLWYVTEFPGTSISLSNWRNPLVVQWLGLWTSITGGMGSILGWTKILQDSQHSTPPQKKRHYNEKWWYLPPRTAQQIKWVSAQEVVFIIQSSGSWSGSQTIFGGIWQVS